MERLSSRQSPVIRRFRALASDSDFRRREGKFLCDGRKLLEEALRSGFEPGCVLWRGTRGAGLGEMPPFAEGSVEEYALTESLFDYVSPMKNSPGPLCSLSIPQLTIPEKLSRALVLEEVQDPGNVGTILRTADAFGIDLVVLLEGCADPYAPKTVRAGMGAVFRQPTLSLKREELPAFCREKHLRLWGAALSERAKDVRNIAWDGVAVAVGSEGHGLSEELLSFCEGELIIPMRGKAESLNAGVAAALLMWEMQR